MVYLIKNIIFSSNSYLITEEEKKTCIIIDPGLDDLEIDNKIQELNLSPIAIISTHGHFDHIAGVSYFKNKYSIPFYLHEEDIKISKSANFFLKIAGLKQSIKTPSPDFIIKGDFQNINITNFSLEVYKFAGHSNGSTVIKWGNVIFTGDIIYKKNLGFNNFPGEDINKLRESIIRLFKTFADETIVYPGHGGSEYLGVIKQNNIELNKFISNK